MQLITATEQNAAPLADLQLYGSYSRIKADGAKETWEELVERVLFTPVSGLFAIGKYTQDEEALIAKMLLNRKAFGSARFMWCGGTSWIANPNNWCGAFNCVSRHVKTPEDFGILMGLGMQGCGTGAVLEKEYISQLPRINNFLLVKVTKDPQGLEGGSLGTERTAIHNYHNEVFCVFVGDSRQGWVEAYQFLINLAMSAALGRPVEIEIDLSRVRIEGSPIKGFGGIANPRRLGHMYERVAKILNNAIGRQLNSVECTLLIDEPATTIAAGGVRRFAGMKQYSKTDELAAKAKADLWVCDKHGKWRIDPEREALQASNHTRVFHTKPTLEECTDSVQKQWQTGEGAIQWAGEAVARGNADLLNTVDKKLQFLKLYPNSAEFLTSLYQQQTGQDITPEELTHRMMRYGLNPCGEAIVTDNFCNLATVHLGQIDPANHKEQTEAFRAGALQAASFLERGFTDERFQKAREFDPIVLVSFTEAFDFFARAGKIEYLRWWQAGRPIEDDGRFRKMEQDYLAKWRGIVHQTVWQYCDRNNLKRPNRCTGIKPEGSTTLLTGVGCCGVHPPKSWRYIRRKNFRKNDPIALAAIDYGYSVVPGRNDKDLDGNLLNDPFSPLCTEWVCETPVEEQLVRLIPEIDTENIDPGTFSAAAQFDWFMQVQTHYSTHNVSCTLELFESEIPAVASLIYQAIQADAGYISMALLSRFNDRQAFPRLPFEPISKETYSLLVTEIQTRRKSEDFNALVKQHLNGVENSPHTPACDSLSCQQ
jgi:ribonucleotide reductase class II